MDMQDIRECAYVCETNMNSFQNETMYVDNILILYHIHMYVYYTYTVVCTYIRRKVYFEWCVLTCTYVGMCNLNVLE